MVHSQADGNSSKLDESWTCEVCKEEDGGCSCDEFLSQFALLNEQLRSLGLLHKVAGEAFVSVIHIEVRRNNLEMIEAKNLQLLLLNCIIKAFFQSHKTSSIVSVLIANEFF